jgi:hypothetical protein
LNLTAVVTMSRRQSIDLDDGALTRRISVGAEDLQLSEPHVLHASPCGRFAAGVNVSGLNDSRGTG